MNKLYSHVVDSKIVSTGAAPKWFNDASEPLTDAEWAEHGRYPVQEADPIPDGKISTGREVQLIGGVPKWVHTLVDEPAPTQADVIAERETRLAAGFDYDFGDARGIHNIGTTPEDMRRWNDEVGPYAQALINSGNPDGQITIATNTGGVTVTATEWQAILIAAAQFRQPLYLSSFALMAMDPIPADYADDAHWP